MSMGEYIAVITKILYNWLENRTDWLNRKDSRRDLEHYENLIHGKPNNQRADKGIII